MASTEVVYVARCDTHHALYGQNLEFRYLDGFLLSAAYMFSDYVACIVFDKGRSLEHSGVPIGRVVAAYRQEYGTQPWLICDKCADYLSLSEEDRRGAREAAARALTNPNEVGHTAEIPNFGLKNRDALAIGYASRLIPTNKEMASLAVFYDEIWVPHPCDLSPNGTKNIASFYRDLAGENFAIPQLQAAQDQYAKKKERWKDLFDEGVLRTMPPFERFGGVIKDDSTIAFNDYASWFSRLPKEAASFANETQHLESLVLAMHRLDAKKHHPELFISDPQDTSTAKLSGFLNDAILACRIPMLASLNADQILELREKVQDAKQGYRQYINQLTDDVEGRVLSGHSTEFDAARKTAERKVIPAYEEYLKQLKATEAGLGAKLLAAGGKFLQVDAAPWTPKFWGAILECFSTVIGSAAEQNREAYLSNEKQAFHYLATVERSAKG